MLIASTPHPRAPQPLNTPDLGKPVSIAPSARSPRPAASRCRGAAQAEGMLMADNIHCRPIMPPSNLAAHWHGKPMHALRLATIAANLRRLLQ